MSALLAAFRMSVRIFALPLMVSYSGSKSPSMSTPMRDFGRSLTCPTLAMTS